MTKEKELFNLISAGETSRFLEYYDHTKDSGHVNSYGQSLLQDAIASDRFDIVDFLISKKANLNHADKNNATALHYTLSRKWYDYSLKLIESGVNIHHEDVYGNQALWTALLNTKNRFDVIEVLLQKGADKDHKNKVGKSPKDMVIKFNVKELLDIFNRY